MNAKAAADMTRRVRWAAVVGVFVVVLIGAGYELIRHYGFGVQGVTYEAVLVLLAIASLIDMRSRTVPTWVVGALLVLWVATVWFIPCVRLPGAVGDAFASIVGADTTAVVLDGIAGGFITGGGMLLLSIAVEAALSRSSFGGGDIKLLFGVGLFLGLPASLTMLLVACLIAIALSFIMRLLFPDGLIGNEIEEPFLKRTIPFAPSVALATTILLVFGPFSLF